MDPITIIVFVYTQGLQLINVLSQIASIIGILFVLQDRYAKRTQEKESPNH